MPKPSRTMRAAACTCTSAVRGRSQRLPRVRPDTPLSEPGRQFLAGVLAHAPRADARHQPVGQLLQAAVRRLRGADRHRVDADRRRGLVRVPSTRPERETASRIELRSPDPGANPYLTSRSCSPPACGDRARLPAAARGRGGRRRGPGCPRPRQRDRPVRGVRARSRHPRRQARRPGRAQQARGVGRATTRRSAPGSTSASCALL